MDILKLRRRIVEAHPELGPRIERWLRPDLAEGMCPHGHPNMWVRIGDGFSVFCPGGGERACAPDLRRIAEELRAEALANGDRGATGTSRRRKQFRRVAELVTPTLEGVRHAQTILAGPPVSEEQLAAMSPVPIPADPREHWRPFLSTLFRPKTRVWIGQPHETGTGWADRVRLVSDWLELPAAPGPQVCLANLRGHDRCEAGVIFQHLWMAEADRYTDLDRQRAALAGMIRAGMPITAATYSGGKSIHIIFAVTLPTVAAEIAAALKRQLYDTGGFRPAATTRLPGWLREDVQPQRWQRLLYLAPPPQSTPRGDPPPLRVERDVSAEARAKVRRKASEERIQISLVRSAVMHAVLRLGSGEHDWSAVAETLTGVQRCVSADLDHDDRIDRDPEGGTGWLEEDAEELFHEFERLDATIPGGWVFTPTRQQLEVTSNEQPNQRTP
jgi:hypothetical protein